MKLFDQTLPHTLDKIMAKLVPIKVGQQRSRMTRLIIITARRFLASKNQFQLAILEFGYLGHRIGSFTPAQHTHYVGQVKVNHN